MMDAGWQASSSILHTQAHAERADAGDAGRHEHAVCINVHSHWLCQGLMFFEGWIQSNEVCA